MWVELVRGCVSVRSISIDLLSDNIEGLDHY